MASTYAVGTVSVSANATALTGSGTSWSSAAILPGALLHAAGLSVPIPIRSVTSDTTITLEAASPVALSGAAYRIVNRLDGGEVSDLLSRLLQQQSRAIDFDGDDKSIRLVTDTGDLWEIFGTDTTAVDQWRLGISAGGFGTFRIQRWTGSAWVDALSIAGDTGVMTWDGKAKFDGIPSMTYSTAKGNIASGTSNFDPNGSGASLLYNTAMGFGALAVLTNGAQNTAFGYHSLYSLAAAAGGGLTCNGNSAFGDRSLGGVVSSSFHTGLGSNAGLAITSGSGNTAVGHGSMAGDDFTPAACTGSMNVALGGWSGQELTSGGGNTLVGANSGMNLTTGQSNVAAGLGALAGTFGSTATAAGCAASYNVALGYGALRGAQSDGQVAVGWGSLGKCTTGQYSTAVGFGSLSESVADNGNSAFGRGSLGLTNGGTSNTAAGFNSGNKNTTGSNNVAVGDSSMYLNQTGSDIVAVGAGAGYKSTVGPAAFVGRNAGVNVTTGPRNTLIGNYAGYGISTGQQNTVVGDSAMFSVNYTNAGAFGYQATVTGDNQVQLGNSSTTTYVYGTVQNRSDARDKTDIRDTVLGLDFIEALRPRDFRWNYRSDYVTTSLVASEEVDDDGRPIMVEHREEIPNDGSRARHRHHHGLIAQEVAETCRTLGVDFGGYQDHAVNGGEDVLSIGYDELIAPLIRAVQELSARVKSLEAAAGA